jgi:glyoxylase-like metal-dependent hydrolase (beta-lactamase superfamily II)
MNIINVGYDSTNYYALEIQGGKLLVDCGWPGTLPKLAAALKRKGSSLGEVRWLLVTHLHPDHAGIAQEICNQGTRLLLMESQPPFIAPMEELFKKRGLAYVPVVRDIAPLRFVESRKFLADLGLAGEILSTPGHSDDSVTLILDEGAAFTGDLAPLFMLPEEDSVSRASWERIYARRITRIYPAHGG